MPTGLNSKLKKFYGEDFSIPTGDTYIDPETQEIDIDRLTEDQKRILQQKVSGIRGMNLPTSAGVGIGGYTGNVQDALAEAGELIRASGNLYEVNPNQYLKYRKSLREKGESVDSPTPISDKIEKKRRVSEDEVDDGIAPGGDGSEGAVAGGIGPQGISDALSGLAKGISLSSNPVTASLAPFAFALSFIDSLSIALSQNAVNNAISEQGIDPNSEQGQAIASMASNPTATQSFSQATDNQESYNSLSNSLNAMNSFNNSFSQATQNMSNMSELSNSLNAMNNSIEASNQGIIGNLGNLASQIGQAVVGLVSDPLQGFTHDLGDDGPEGSSNIGGMSTSESNAMASEESGGDSIGGSGICIIVTTCTHRYSDEVNITREFRDKYLDRSSLGGYYAIANVVVPLLKKYKRFKLFTKKYLVDRLIDYAEKTMGHKNNYKYKSSVYISKIFLGACKIIGKMVNTETLIAPHEV